MTMDELRRILQYAMQLQVSGGRLSVLTCEERQDLKMLLEKWLAENEDQPTPVIQSRQAAE